MKNNKVLDVDAILGEMNKTRGTVALEIANEHEAPLILREDNQFSLEELIEELEATEDIVFNI